MLPSRRDDFWKKPKSPFWGKKRPKAQIRVSRSKKDLEAVNLTLGTNADELT